VRDFPRHQELERVLSSGIVTEIDQALVHDLRARLGRDVTTQIHVDLAGDLEIIGGPGITLRIEQSGPAASRHRDQWVDMSGEGVGFQRLQMHPRERPHHFKVTELLGADIHQHVLDARIIAVQALHRILQRRRQFAVGAAKLFPKRGSGVPRFTEHINLLTW